MSWRGSNYFPPSTPRAAKGGIKAQSRQGSFGESWWAKRWIAVLESFQIGARLQRGRSYARRGQVLTIKIDTGRVTAQVQGSRPRPYDVEIKVKTLAKSDGGKLATALAQQAVFAAKLLAGQMPQEIERVFAAAGLSLFPSQLRDLQTECSCPDWSNPCKHIAAVYYLVGEEFDRDPFLIFKLRGVDRDKLIAGLGADHGAKVETPGKRRAEASRSSTHIAPTAQAAAQPIDSAPRAYWVGAELPAESFGAISASPRSPLQAALLKRLGSFPFWRGNERFFDALAPVYAQASQRACDALFGERVQERPRARRPRIRCKGDAEQVVEAPPSRADHVP